VAITPRGQSLLKRVLPAHYAALDETMSRLSAQERRRLADLLDRVTAPDRSGARHR
jgi:DNA-binding MarR family transcriptional regulator